MKFFFTGALLASFFSQVAVAHPTGNWTFGSALDDEIVVGTKASAEYENDEAFFGYDFGLICDGSSARLSFFIESDFAISGERFELLVITPEEQTKHTFEMLSEPLFKEGIESGAIIPFASIVEQEALLNMLKIESKPEFHDRAGIVELWLANTESEPLASVGWQGVGIVTYAIEGTCGRIFD